jgi:hypothetical protein
MGVSIYLGFLEIALSTEDGLQIEVDNVFRVGLLGAYRG